jgi:phosphatidylserine/phosphatidylglycerophosphate/cardiolipin synthase-like enzyme
MEQALLGLINSAATSVDLAIYDFNRDSIRDALISAHMRGVSVRVVTDDEVRYRTVNYIPYYQALEDAGISIVDDQRGGSIMHDKYFIVDGRYVWTGSTNMSDNGFTLNHNNALLLDSPMLAALYEADFEQMFVEGSFSIHKNLGGARDIDYNGIPLELYFSPKDDALSEVIAEVQSAKESITFAIFYFTSDELRDALIERAQAGVEIRGIWDALGASNQYSDDESLCAAGIPIKIATYAGKMHNKFMVIDANGPAPRVISGSMNWTVSGDEDNDENSLIIHDLAVAQAYRDMFDTLYDTLPSDTECETDSIGLAYRILLPVVLSNTGSTLPTADIQLSSIVYNPAGSDAEGEHVIIENLGVAAQDLQGWVLTDIAGARYTFPEFRLNPGKQVVVWVKPGTNTSIDLFWGRGSAVWNNDGDTATLASISGLVVDVCTYEGGGEVADCN